MAGEKCASLPLTRLGGTGYPTWRVSFQKAGFTATMCAVLARLLSNPKCGRAGGSHRRLIRFSQSRPIQMGRRTSKKPC